MYGSCLLLIRAPHLSRVLQFSGKKSDFYSLISNARLTVFLATWQMNAKWTLLTLLKVALDLRLLHTQGNN